MNRLDDETLNAYFDGELAPDDHDRVSTELARDPGARARLQAIRRVSQLGRAAVDGLSHGEVPEHIQEQVWTLPRQPARGRPRHDLRITPAWAVAIVLGLGVALGFGLWFTPRDDVLNTEPALQPVAWHKQAALFHGLVAERHNQSRPVLLDFEHSETGPLEASLLTRLEGPVVVPDLTGYGLQLLGARLLVEGHRPLAQVFYDDPQDNLVSLLVALDSGPDAPPQFRRVDQTPVLSWRERGSAYVLAGDRGQEHLQVLAGAVMEQAR